jgi:hypothetical protein
MLMSAVRGENGNGNINVNGNGNGNRKIWLVGNEMDLIGSSFRLVGLVSPALNAG